MLWDLQPGLGPLWGTQEMFVLPKGVFRQTVRVRDGQKKLRYRNTHTRGDMKGGRSGLSGRDETRGGVIA